jgi:hypothetical protein
VWNFQSECEFIRKVPVPIGRQDDVADFIFVALSILFFVVSIGYVAVCDRLMK